MDNSYYDKFIYYSHARTALKYGLLSLGLKKGDNILIPEFICDVLIQPLKNIGLKIVYYPINQNLQPHWEQCQGTVSKKSRAILMVHYFGQPQRIDDFKNFCRTNNLFLIEDCAHAFNVTFKHQLLGTFGDIGIFSPQKYSYVISGGLLLINRPEIAIEKKAYLPKYQINYKKSFFRFVNKNFSPRIKLWSRKFFFSRPIYEDPYNFKEEKLKDYSIDDVSKNDIRSINWDKFSRRQKLVYSSWMDIIEPTLLSPVFIENRSSSPQCLPVFTMNNEHSIKLFNWGWGNGYYIYSWPALPDKIINQKGEALSLWKRLVCVSLDREFDKRLQKSFTAVANDK